MKNAWKSSLTAVVLLMAVTPTALAASLQAPTTSQAMTAGAKYMLTNQLSKMQDWTLVSTFASLSTHQSGTWSTDTVAKLSTTTDMARTILGVLAAGQDPHHVNGLNLVDTLAKTQLQSGNDAGKFADNLDGSGTDLINNQSWSIIALEDAGHADYNRVAAGQWLLAHQNKDGGFGYSNEYNTSDADDTAAAIVALSLLGFKAESTPIVSAVAFLKTQQVSDGGFENGSTTSNADSTGVVMDALESVGINPETWAQSGGTPTSSLLSLFDSSAGGFKFDNSGQSWSGVGGMSTRDALIGLGAVTAKQSVYQRLHWKWLDSVNDYWTAVYEQGGAYDHHQWKSWLELRPMAVAGTYFSSLTPAWQAVIRAHGMKVQHGHATTWESWDSTLATQALIDSFGQDTVHLNGLA